MSKAKTYTAAGITGPVKQFADLAGISCEHMRRRLSLFAKGKFPEDKLLEGMKADATGNLSWKSLSDSPRSERLTGIKPPTPFDTL